MGSSDNRHNNDNDSETYLTQRRRAEDSIVLGKSTRESLHQSDSRSKESNSTDNYINCPGCTGDPTDHPGYRPINSALYDTAPFNVAAFIEYLDYRDNNGDND